MDVLKIEVSPGELIDKYTILCIKEARIKSPEKLAFVRHEKTVLKPHVECVMDALEDFDALYLVNDLEIVNAKLWDVEDQIRACEAKKSFGEDFVRLARAVYQLNDRRGELKRHINDWLESPLIEQKEYTSY